MLVSIWLFAFGILGSSAVSATGELEDCDDFQPKDFSQLQKYANIASVAYCTEVGLKEGVVGTQGAQCPSKACSHQEAKDLLVVKTFEFTGVFEVGSGIIAVDGKSKTIYLAFRGTSTYLDWFNNLSMIPVSYHPLVITSDEFDVTKGDCVHCRVHKGINSFLKLNGAKVIKEVVKIRNEHPLYRIVVTGHSLGAALATFAGIELRLLGYDVLVVTLAGPRIGEKNFARFVDELFQTDKVIEIINKEKAFDHIQTGLIRMVHLHDIVPYLPPTKYWKHSGYEYYLAAEGVTQTPDTIERRGKNYVEDEPLDYSEVIPSVRRLDHANYFLPVSRCVP